MKKMTLEEANKIAIKHGYHSYGEFHEDLYRHGITLEQYVKNGECFEPKIKHLQNMMPESVFNAITKRIMELEDQKEYLANTKGSLQKAAQKEMKKVDVEIRELTEYRKAHYR